MSLKVAIVDDEPLARERLAGFLAQKEGVTLAGEAGDGPGALELIRSKRPDLVFLDIQMPGMTGLELLRSLGEEEIPETIFVTAHSEHAVAAFELHALDYLLKPCSEERFHQALERARERIESRASGKFGERVRAWIDNESGPGTLRRLSIKSEGRIRFVPVDEIDWVEAAGNYLVIHARGERHVLRETLGALEQKLPARQFLRVSRFAIIHLDRLEELRTVGPGDYLAVLKGGAEVPVTRPLREVEQRLKFDR